MGVKVTLRRTHSIEAQAVCRFEEAEGWNFNSIRTLLITKKKKNYDIELPLAEFPIECVESVEFA